MTADDDRADEVLAVQAELPEVRDHAVSLSAALYHAESCEAVEDLVANLTQASTDLATMTADVAELLAEAKRIRARTR